MWSDGNWGNVPRKERSPSTWFRRDQLWILAYLLKQIHRGSSKTDLKPWIRWFFLIFCLVIHIYICIWLITFNPCFRESTGNVVKHFWVPLNTAAWILQEEHSTGYVGCSWDGMVLGWCTQRSLINCWCLNDQLLPYFWYQTADGPWVLNS